MKRTRRLLLGFALLFALGWTLLSVIVELEDPRPLASVSQGTPRALIVYHPSWTDGFQDELTLHFARGLAEAGWGVDRVSAHSGVLPDPSGYRLVAFGTNTYYWRPDLPTKRLLGRWNLEGKPCVGLVSGAGSTRRAERVLQALIEGAGGRALEIHPFWLWKPNDESRMEEPNRLVALARARDFGKRVAEMSGIK